MVAERCPRQDVRNTGGEGTALAGAAGWSPPPGRAPSLTAGTSVCLTPAHRLPWRVGAGSARCGPQGTGPGVTGPGWGREWKDLACRAGGKGVRGWGREGDSAFAHLPEEPPSATLPPPPSTVVTVELTCPVLGTPGSATDQPLALTLEPPPCPPPRSACATPPPAPKHIARPGSGQSQALLIASTQGGQQGPRPGGEGPTGPPAREDRRPAVAARPPRGGTSRLPGPHTDLSPYRVPTRCASARPARWHRDRRVSPAPPPLPCTPREAHWGGRRLPGPRGAPTEPPCSRLAASTRGPPTRAWSPGRATRPPAVGGTGWAGCPVPGWTRLAVHVHWPPPVPAWAPARPPTKLPRSTSGCRGQTPLRSAPNFWVQGQDAAPPLQWPIPLRPALGREVPLDLTTGVNGGQEPFVSPSGDTGPLPGRARPQPCMRPGAICGGTAVSPEPTLPTAGCVPTATREPETGPSLRPRGPAG